MTLLLAHDHKITLVLTMILTLTLIRILTIFPTLTGVPGNLPEAPKKRVVRNAKTVKIGLASRTRTFEVDGVLYATCI